MCISFFKRMDLLWLTLKKYFLVIYNGLFSVHIIMWIMEFLVTITGCILLNQHWILPATSLLEMYKRHSTNFKPVIHQLSPTKRWKKIIFMSFPQSLSSVLLSLHLFYISFFFSWFGKMLRETLAQNTLQEYIITLVSNVSK